MGLVEDWHQTERRFVLLIRPVLIDRDRIRNDRKYMVMRGLQVAFSFTWG